MKKATCPICGRKYKMTRDKKNHQTGEHGWWPKNQCGAHLQLKEGPK